MLEFALRMRPLRLPAFLLLIPAMALAAQAFGPSVLAPMAAVPVVLFFTGATLPRTSRPDIVLVLAVVAMQACAVAFTALADFAPLDSLCLLMLPLLAASIIFPLRGMVVFTVWNAAVMVAAAFLIDPSKVHAEPPVLFLPLGVMVCIALPAAYVRYLEVTTRAIAAVDALTGAMNRAAFDERIGQLGPGRRVDSGLAAVLVCDLDAMRSVNHAVGHDGGDETLREAVRRIRRTVGAEIPVYRVSGERFAVVLTGMEQRDVERQAERIREATRERPIAGLPVTASLGTVTGSLDEYDAARLFATASDALTLAKQTGRDRVVTATLGAAPSMVLPAGAVQPPQATIERESTPDRRTSGQRIGLDHDSSNWFVKGDSERDHIREASWALRKVHGVALACVGLALIASIPWLGWKLMVPAAFVVPVFIGLESRVRTLRRPEIVLEVAWLAAQVAIASGALIVPHPQPYMLVLLLAMMVGMTAIMPPRVGALNAVASFLLLVFAAVVSRPGLFEHRTGVMLPQVAVLLGLAMLGRLTGRAAIEYRIRTAVDPVTGLLTAAALRSRLADFGRYFKDPAITTSVISFELDNLRGHGISPHAESDERDRVLADLGDQLRTNLRPLDWAFRLSDNQFVVLIGADGGNARGLAERLRRVVSQLTAPSGDSVAASFGVASSVKGESFRFEQLLGRAEQASRGARESGSDCVWVYGEHPSSPDPAPSSGAEELERAA